MACCTKSKRIAHLIDHNAAVRASVQLLLRVRAEVRCHASANASLRVAAPDVGSCLMIDVEIPGIGGLDRSLIRPARRPKILGSQAGFHRHYLCFSFINGAKEFSGEGAR